MQHSCLYRPHKVIDQEYRYIRRHKREAYVLQPLKRSREYPEGGLVLQVHRLGRLELERLRSCSLRGASSVSRDGHITSHSDGDLALKKRRVAPVVEAGEGQRLDLRARVQHCQLARLVEETGMVWIRVWENAVEAFVGDAWLGEVEIGERQIPVDGDDV